MVVIIIKNTIILLYNPLAKLNQCTECLYNMSINNKISSCAKTIEDALV